MADQKAIDTSSIKIAALVDKARAEMVHNLYDIGTEMDNMEAFTKALLELDITGTLRNKLKNATNLYTMAHRNVLESTIGFANVKASTLTSFISLNQDVFDSTLVNTIASHIRNEVIKGVQSGLSATQITESVINSSISTSQIETLVNTTLNSYSRTITNSMMDIAPDNTKYVYIGPVDEKTRPECIRMSAAGRLTLKQIKSFPNLRYDPLTLGGGFNCRHKWEIASTEGTRFHEQKDAKRAEKRLPNA